MNILFLINISPITSSWTGRNSYLSFKNPWKKTFIGFCWYFRGYTGLFLSTNSFKDSTFRRTHNLRDCIILPGGGGEEQDGVRSTSRARRELRRRVKGTGAHFNIPVKSASMETCPGCQRSQMVSRSVLLVKVLLLQTHRRHFNRTPANRTPGSRGKWITVWWGARVGGGKGGISAIVRGWGSGVLWGTISNCEWWYDRSWFRDPPMPACGYVEENGLAAMLAAKKRSAGVAPEVNLKREWGCPIWL